MPRTALRQARARRVTRTAAGCVQAVIFCLFIPVRQLIGHAGGVELDSPVLSQEGQLRRAPSPGRSTRRLTVDGYACGCGKHHLARAGRVGPVNKGERASCGWAGLGVCRCALAVGWGWWVLVPWARVFVPSMPHDVTPSARPVPTCAPEPIVVRCSRGTHDSDPVPVVVPLSSTQRRGEQRFYPRGCGIVGRVTVHHV